MLEPAVDEDGLYRRMWETDTIVRSTLDQLVAEVERLMREDDGPPEVSD